MSKKPYSELEKSMQTVLEDFIHTYKRRPSKRELDKLRQNLFTKIQGKIKQVTDREFTKIYKENVALLSKDLSIPLTINKIDTNALFLIKNNPILYRSFANMSTKLSNKVSDIIFDSYKDPKGIDLNKINDMIKKVSGVSSSIAETIARTETSRISNTARFISYKKDPRFNDFKFKWAGPPASEPRTTSTCANIMRRTKNGVSWDKLVEIVTEESAKEFPKFNVDPVLLVAHWNCRHHAVRTGIIPKITPEVREFINTTDFIATA